MALYEDISSGDEEASQLFITQSSFHEPDTQTLDHAADEVGLDDFDLSDVHVLNAQDLQCIQNHHADQFTMCEKIFDFIEGDAYNGWSVESQEDPNGPYTVTRSSDGKQFVVGEGFCEEIPEISMSKDSTDPPPSCAWGWLEIYLSNLSNFKALSKCCLI